MLYQALFQELGLQQGQNTAIPSHGHLELSGREELQENK